MIKLRIDKTFEISDKEFDKYCKQNRVGRGTAKVSIRKMLETRIWEYVRDLDRLVLQDNLQTHMEESVWKVGKAPKGAEKKLREIQYKLFRKEKRDE